MGCAHSFALLIAMVCATVLHVVRVDVAAQPSGSVVQAEILLQFKQAITRDPSGALRSWINSSSRTAPSCGWSGIACNNQQTVVSIALAGFNLEGSITPLIGGITSLLHIDLSMNALSGLVPSSLGMLPHLQTLKLASNRFIGSIPPSLSNCSALILLDVSNNMISHGIPTQLGSLPGLKALLLSHNLFEDTVPPSLANASSLQFLVASHNRISGPVPPSVGYLKSLLFLNLASNNLTGQIPVEITAMVALQGLDLHDNRLGGTVPAQLTACSFLAVVKLSKNLLTGSIPAQLGEMQSLRVLQLNNNMLSGAIPSSLGNCMRMEDLVLSHNMLHGGIPSRVASLPNLLLSFAVSHNSLTGPIPPQIGHMTQVQKIDLAHNHLSDSIPEELGACSGLQFLDLSNNQLNGLIPELLGTLLSLTSMLNLSHNSLQGSIPDFQKLIYLKSIDLSHNELTGPIPSALTTLQSLTLMNLSFNKFSGCFPQVESFILKHMTSSWIQGNPNLCVPSLSGFCNSHACSPHSSTRLARYLWIPVSLAFLVWLGIGIYFCLAEHLYSRSSITSPDLTGSAQSRIFNIYSAEELNSAMNRIDTSVLIGSGASSDVYRVQFGNGQVCAVKLFKPTAREQLFNTELDILMNLRHRNLVSVRGVCRQGTTRAILLDYMENGSLRKQRYEMESCSLDLERRIQIARDVAEGLLYLHQDALDLVVHCDVKPANILLDKDFTAHVADFGLAAYAVGGLSKRRRHLTLSSTQLLRLPGTLGYIAPGATQIKEHLCGVGVNVEHCKMPPPDLHVTLHKYLAQLKEKIVYVFYTCHTHHRMYSRRRRRHRTSWHS